MTRTKRTNPEYAAMAFRKALLRECITHLTGYTPVMGVEPKGKIISEDVFREDSELPQEVIEEYLLELQQEEEALRLEMKRFDFVKRDSDEQPKAEKSNERSQPSRKKGRRPRKGQ